MPLKWKFFGTLRIEKDLRNDARAWLSKNGINALPLSKSGHDGHGAPSVSSPSFIAHCGRCHACEKAWRFRLISKRVMQIEITGEGEFINLLIIFHVRNY